MKDKKLFKILTEFVTEWNINQEKNSTPTSWPDQSKVYNKAEGRILRWNKETLSAHFSPVKGMEVSVELIFNSMMEELEKTYPGMSVYKNEEGYERWGHPWMWKAAENIHAKLSAQHGRGTESR